MRSLVLTALMILICTAGAAAIEPSGSPADTAGTSADSLLPPRYVLQIERLETTRRSLLDTLDVTLETFGHTVAAFGLKIGSTHPAVDIIGILPGALVDTCGWDFFRADRVDTKSEANMPRTLWKAVALSKTTPDTTRPDCVGFRSKITIARLIVATPPSARFTDTLAPLFFYWEDCRDNALSDASGQSLMFSSRVFDYLPVPLADKPDVFPTRLGTPTQCIKVNAVNPPRRTVEFHNGGVLFTLGKPAAAGKK